MAPKIAIIGAGPGGCMLARLLHLSSIPCTIFEGEKSIDYRAQGGTLDLRARTGLQAIKDARLWDEFQKHARYDGESLLLLDKSRRTWLKRQARKTGEQQKKSQPVQEAPEIDRAVLRKMLLESVPDGAVRWGYRLKRVERDRSLVFENGEIEKGYDLIVGADGAFSKTRNFLSSEQPFYTGIGGYSMSIPDPEERTPELCKLINRGSVFAFGDMKTLNCQQMGNGTFNVSYYGHYHEDFPRTCGFDVADPEAVKEHLRKELHDWTPELKAIFENVQGTVTWRNLYMLPVGFRWEHSEGVTLLGDAAHLMTPFAGIGVNNALHDALMLSRAIVAHVESRDGALDRHIRDYEREMFAFTTEAAKLTEGCMNDMMNTPGAPRATIESYVLRHAKVEFPRWFHPILSAVIHTIYFCYKLFV